MLSKIDFSTRRTIFAGIEFFSDQGENPTHLLVDSPEFYLWARKLLKTNCNISLDPPTYRKILARVTKAKSSQIRPDVKDAVQRRIARLGKRRWDFQVLLSAVVVQAVPRQVEDVTPNTEDESDLFYLRAFDVMAKVGRCNFEAISIPVGHCRNSAIHFFAKFKGACSYDGDLCYACFPIDFFQKRKTALYCNKNAIEVSGVNHEQEFQFLVAPEAGEDWYRRTINTPIGHIISFGFMPMMPKNPGDPYYYININAFPHGNLLYFVGVFVPSLETVVKFDSEKLKAEYPGCAQQIEDGVLGW